MVYKITEKQLASLCAEITKQEKEKTVSEFMGQYDLMGDVFKEYFEKFAGKNDCYFNGIELTGEESKAIKDVANKIERNAL